MGDAGPTRHQTDLAEMVEMLLDQGVVINADVVVSIGDTELLGIEVRAAVASFETAAKYGLEFPSGTDMRRVEDAADVRPVVRGEEAEEGELEDGDPGEDEDQTQLTEQLEIEAGRDDDDDES